MSPHRQEPSPTPPLWAKSDYESWLEWRARVNEQLHNQHETVQEHHERLVQVEHATIRTATSLSHIEGDITAIREIDERQRLEEKERKDARQRALERLPWQIISALAALAAITAAIWGIVYNV